MSTRRGQVWPVAFKSHLSPMHCLAVIFGGQLRDEI